MATVSQAIAMGYKLHRVPLHDNRTGRTVESWMLTLDGGIVSVRRDVDRILDELQA